MRRLIFLAAILATSAIAGEPLPLAPAVRRADNLVAAGPFKPDWASLKAHKDPEWFRDAKFGIYANWGPVTIGSSATGGQGYSAQLYVESWPGSQWHRTHFGDPKTIGYKDVIPHFKAEKFDPEAWADLFAKAGARFAGPVAAHADNFAMWASQVTRWNSGAMGPHRDITGELEQAIRKRGLRFFTSFHHGVAWTYYEPSYKFDGADPKFADLYATPHTGGPPDQRFLDQWLGMVNEVLDKYHPDLIWFDFDLGNIITPAYQQRMFATVYNWADQTHREIGVAHKDRDIHQHTGLLDFERGREDRLTPYPWLTDTSVGTWFYVEGDRNRPLNELVDIFVDIVAKNGCMLLNVPPRADGSFPEASREMLLGLGQWLRVNGEAIYETRPWLAFGEGPTRGGGGAFSEEHGDRAFTAKDVRFTTKGRTLYALALGWPADGKLLIRSLASDAGKLSAVSLLGHGGPIKWTQTDAGLSVTLPVEKPCDFASTLKIAGENLRPSPQASAVPTLH